jgi:hypothetical protein
MHPKIQTVQGVRTRECKPISNATPPPTLLGGSRSHFGTATAAGTRQARLREGPCRADRGERWKSARAETKCHHEPQLPLSAWSASVIARRRARNRVRYEINRVDSH